MDWMKFRKIYFVISALVIGLGALAYINWGIKLGIDFTGGSLAEYKFEDEILENELTERIKEVGLEVSLIKNEQENTVVIKTNSLSTEEREKLKTTINSYQNNVEELSFETVGPTIGPELVKKTLYALALSAVAILLWISYQFKNIKFGASAVLAMLHDSLVLLGSFAILGHFAQAQIDFLFVTAMLTTLAFSVHDTIVVFDRVRELQRTVGGNIYDLANNAISETMVRSLNNSFTIIFMLISLVLLGGESIRWFAVALLIGTISGTYSSPFVAVPILVTWDRLKTK